MITAIIYTIGLALAVGLGHLWRNRREGQLIDELHSALVYERTLSLRRLHRLHERERTRTDRKFMEETLTARSIGIREDWS